MVDGGEGEHAADRRILRAEFAARLSARVRLPWETGLMGVVLGGRPALQSPADWELPVPLPPSGWQEVAVVPPVAPPRPRTSAREGLGPAEEDRRARELAVEKWFVLVRAMGDHCDLARKARAGGKGALRQSLVDALAPKAEATLKSRGGVLEAYFRWVRARRLQVVPVTEAVVYSYFAALRDAGAPPSRAKSTMSALAFAAFVLGLDGVKEALASPRVRGVTFAQFAKKRLTEGRSPLTKRQVEFLQCGVAAFPQDVDKLLAGFCCTCLATRLRFADAQRARSEPFLDLVPEGEGFLELPLGKVKAVRTVLAGTASKAAVGHATGLAGEQWARAWLELRVKLGLNVKKDGCLLPSPAPGGGFHRRRMRSDELLAWMKRQFSAVPGLQLKGQRVGSHSCKKTLLSWCAKFGLGKEVRRDLGYHASKGDRSMSA